MSDPDEWCFALDFLLLLHHFSPSALFPSSYLVPDPQFSYVRTFPPHGSSRELARFPVCFRRIVSRPRTSAVGVGTSFNLRDAT